ncbi:hypothetical protein Cob_v000636 [Colletotrichum orbiculare MAFF 240422]|uniref:Uncharacterized protein n=1 Tax=Colletotrichum orbiculare (strain 104-T / ATCC 96160 / CBS 514.97 / LARS 414 / MAFF 240422) TaxID=1213857 RepID=A0A484G5K6_COLOR|nr:hypothetical protein Cob_v000636 [Colletotrichum orbiculare MAFF 240422]
MPQQQEHLNAEHDCLHIVLNATPVPVPVSVGQSPTTGRQKTNILYLYTVESASPTYAVQDMPGTTRLPGCSALPP